MLVNYYTNNSSLPQGAVGFRDRFQAELNQLGMPQNLKKVSLINGSIMGALNGVSSAKTLKVEGDIDSFIFLPYLPVTSIVLTGLVNIFADGVLSNFYNTTNKKYGNDQTFTFDGGIRGSFLWWEWWTTRTTFKSQLKAKGGFDVSPGGYFNAQQLVADESKSKDTYLYVIFNAGVQTGATVYEPTHSFIPTKSALAYTGSNVLDEVIGNKNRVCTGETPFDSYFAPSDNEEHITLTKENVAWLKAELEGNPKSASVYKTIDSSSLTGSLAVCDNKTNIYSLDIPNTCSGLTVSWSTSSNIQIQSSTNNSITVTPINGTNDAIGYVKAYIHEQNKYIEKFVWVGIPNPDFLHISKVGSYQFYSNQWTKLKVVHPVPPIELMNNDPSYGLTYQWSVPNSQIRTFTDTSTIDVNPFNSGQLNIGVKMENQCGCTNYKYQLFNVTSQSSGGSGGGGILTPIGKI